MVPEITMRKAELVELCRLHHVRRLEVFGSAAGSGFDSGSDFDFLVEFETLPPGSYDVRLYSPVTGQYSPAIEFKGGGKSALTLPAFKEDIVIRATRREK